MSKKNSKARKQLKKIFGDGCFIERMGLREIKGYRTIDRMITYHHIKKKSEGGRATVENGANLAWENHQWLHSLPEEEQDRVNEMIQNWKLAFVEMKGSGKVIQTGTIDSKLDFSDLTSDEDCIIIKLEETTKEQFEELQRQKENKRQKFNRSKIKRETKKLINEIIDEEEIEL